MTGPAPDSSQVNALLKVVVIGQVPPPYGGQNVMVAALLEGSYRDTEIVHIPADFSSRISDMGRISLSKVFALIRVLVLALWTRVRWRPSVLYYHPAGGVKSAIYRDLVLLTVLRPFFRTVILHFHSRGLIDATSRLPKPARWLARRAYGHPHVVLAPSSVLLEELAPLEARRTHLLRNGSRGGEPRSDYERRAPLKLLFLNLVAPVKGADWLLDAFAELHARGVSARLMVAGEFESSAYRQEFLARAHELGLADSVEILGLVWGDRKWSLFQSADIFCIPTLHPHEAASLVMIEAASCGLPIVASDVPGVREVLTSGLDVLLADPADRRTLADRLFELCSDDNHRRELGEAARRTFEARYTLDRFWNGVGGVFDMVREGARGAA